MKRVHGYRKKKKENKIWIHVLVAGMMRFLKVLT